jgi:NADH-quinone oxidoreductase subunit D
MAANEIGAISAGFYMLEAREFLYDLVEAITGARLTVTYCRLGGVIKDVPASMPEQTRTALRHVRRVLADCDRLLSRNRIFVDRMTGIGALSRADAISYGLTGPLLRATGVSYDVRKAEPYLVYDRLDFTVPTGTSGDNYDRFRRSTAASKAS